jgi:hypothetical protein
MINFDGNITYEYKNNSNADKLSAIVEVTGLVMPGRSQDAQTINFEAVTRI